MMMNETNVTAEPKPVECRLPTSHATDKIPAARPAFPPVRPDAWSESADTKPTLFSRKTKIITTLGPATESGDVLRSLLEAGVSNIRVNLASIGREAALKAIYAIRSISTELQRPVSLLLDIPLAADPAGSAAMSESAWSDIRFGLEAGVDWMAVSAAQDGDTVRQLRQFLSEQKRNGVGILARVEDPLVLAAPDHIIRESDGVILGLVHFADGRPTAEKLAAARSVAQKCASARKLAIFTAGAEVNLSDAISARPDALLLGEEYNAGPDVLQSVRKLDCLIRQAESSGSYDLQSSIALATKQDETIAAAIQQADETKADAVVVFTRLGNSAGLCAALRPRHSRVFAFTPDARLARRLRLRYALEPVVQPFSEQPQKTLQAAEKVLLERKLLPTGAKVVFVTDILDQGQRISSIQIRTLERSRGKG